MAAKKKAKAKTKIIEKKKKTLAKKVAAKKPAKPKQKPIAKKAASAAKKIIPTPMLLATLKVLDERQAEDIVTINLTGKSSMADYLIVASGRAARQIAAIAHYLREVFEKHGIERVRIEGLPQGDWVLVDGGDIVVHLFRPEVRKYYDIEPMWDRR